MSEDKEISFITSSPAGFKEDADSLPLGYVKIPVVVKQGGFGKYRIVIPSNLVVTGMTAYVEAEVNGIKSTIQLV